MTSATEKLELQADRAAGEGRFTESARLLEHVTSAEPTRTVPWTKLAAMRRAAGDFVGALQAIDRALALNPLDFSILLARAFVLERIDPPRSGEAFCEALAQLPPDDCAPGTLASPIAHARTQCDVYRSTVEERLAASIGGNASLMEQTRIARFASNTARRTKTWHQEPTHFQFPGLPEMEFHDPAAFAGLAALAAIVDVVRDEFEALIAAESSALIPYIQYSARVPLRQWERLNHNPDWSALHLLRNGEQIEANARHCPRTLAALAALDQPDVLGASPNAMFSLLAPRTRIPPHTGVANTRLVAHLPLIVPPACGFRCGATTVEWRAGEPFVFDDTIEHEAWNDSDELRVVMIFDLWPPALSRRERAAVGRIIPASGIAANEEL